MILRVFTLVQIWDNEEVGNKLKIIKKSIDFYV